MRSSLTLLLVVALATPALASDGVLEINQTCAVQTGCFAGDAALFPVTIDGTAGHSYRLTSDLTVPNENTDGIVISAHDVGIDLNNFAILGPVTCSGSPLTCTPSTGTGSGVERTLSTLRGLSVKNGSITGMGINGVQLGDQAEVTNVRSRWNRLAGINVGTGSTVSGNATYQNGNDGILTGAGSTISGNTVFGNGDDGIDGSSGNTIIGNTCYDNGNATSPQLHDGIECTAGCIVRGNSVRVYTGYGLNLGSDSAYSDNVVTLNTTGTVTGTGSPNDRGGNYCAGTGVLSAFCP